MANESFEFPGVSVYQEFVTTTPTILRPALPACVLGPMKQIVEAVANDGSLVPESLISVPARLPANYVSSPFSYNVGKRDLVVRVNNGPPYTITFPGSVDDEPLTVNELAQVIDAEEIPGLMTLVETSGSQKRLVLQTISPGSNSSIQIVSGTHANVLTQLGLSLGYTRFGRGGYYNFNNLVIPQVSYPDPRGNLGQLTIDYGTVRVFLGTGGGNSREITRNTGFVRGAASAVTVVDDGDSDNRSPILNFAGADFFSAPSQAVIPGKTDISGLTWATDVHGKTLKMSVNGDDFQTLVFPDTIASASDLVDAINALWPGIAGLDLADHLELTAQDAFGGAESVIRVDKSVTDSSLLTVLGLTGSGAALENVDAVFGAPHAPMVGDEVWADGVRLGRIVSIPEAPVTRLQLDTEYPLTFTASNWFIIAINLDGASTTLTRPGADLQVDTGTGEVIVKSGLFRSLSGEVSAVPEVSAYLAYQALRLDVSPQSDTFGMVRINGQTELKQNYGPISTQNPLALGLYFASLAAPGLEVTGVGVDETSDLAPEGTIEGYVRAFEHLELMHAYALAPLTHDSTVGQIADAHVTLMSEPENKAERIVFLNPKRPSRQSDTLVASGAEANAAAATSAVQTGVPNLQSLLGAANKPGPTYTISDGVFVRFADDANNYLVLSVSGGQLTISPGPFVSGNEDGFYYDDGTPAFSQAIVDRPFTVYVRGGEITNRTEEAMAYADMGRAYQNRRVAVTMPDTAVATLEGGLTQLIPGYYMAAGLAGLRSAQPPQQPLTEIALPGFRAAVGSTDRYGRALGIVAAGGVWCLETKGSGDSSFVVTKAQLSTDMSSVEKREQSITTAVDFVAYVFRSALTNFSAKYNITTSLLESLSLVAQSLCTTLVETLRVVASLKVVGLRQIADEKDATEIELDCVPLYPNNKIRVRIRI